MQIHKYNMMNYAKDAYKIAHFAQLELFTPDWLKFSHTLRFKENDLRA